MFSREGVQGFHQILKGVYDSRKIMNPWSRALFLNVYSRCLIDAPGLFHYKMQCALLQSPPTAVLEWQGQFLCFCYTQETIEFKRCTREDRTEFQLLFPAILSRFVNGLRT